MNFLPVNLNIRAKKVLVVGGGKVALHKLKTILKFSKNVTVVACEVLPAIKRLGLSVIEEPYNKKFLKGIFLVYACTDSRAVNKNIRKDALARGVLVNVADDRRLCGFISPAVFISRGMVVSVSSQGKDPKACVALRDKIKRYIDGN